MNRKYFKIIAFLFFISACAPKPQAAPTPDMGMLATQMWVQISVEQTLAALIPTATPEPTATPTPLSAPPTRSTPLPPPPDPAAYAPVFNAYNNMELIYIPEGEFRMGSGKTDSNQDENETPAHKVYLDAFWISKTQVTNAMFNACVNAGVCKYSVKKTTNPNYLDPLFTYHPVVYIAWEMAQTYCDWTGGRLPTEAEWEKAARGPGSNRYPWGDDQPSLKYVNAENDVGNTTAAGSFIAGASVYGVLDMGGNVREWVSDWFDPAYYQVSPYRNPWGPETGEKKVLKGASFSDPFRYCRSANRLSHEPGSPGAVRGFRCVYP